MTISILYRNCAHPCIHSFGSSRGVLFMPVVAWEIFRTDHMADFGKSSHHIRLASTIVVLPFQPGLKPTFCRIFGCSSCVDSREATWLWKS